MKGLQICLLVIVAADAVRSQAAQPTRTRKGPPPSRRNDNPDVGLPSGKDVPDGQLAAPYPIPPAQMEPIPAQRRPPASVGRYQHPPVITRPTSGIQNDNPVVPPGRTPFQPAYVPASPVAGGRSPVYNDNPDVGLPSGRDYPDSGSVITRPTGGIQNDSPVVPPGRTPFQPAYVPASPVAGGRPPVYNDNPDVGLPSGRDYPDSGRTGTKFEPSPLAGTASNVPPSNEVLVPPFCESMCSIDGYRPVCGIYGNEYDNDCYRDCNGEPRKCENQCPCPAPVPVMHDPCAYCMTQGFDPVCIEDEKQLQNECYARCQGKKVLCSSHCPC